MLRITNMKLKLPHSRLQLVSKICLEMKIRQEDISDYRIVKQSLDARKKPDIFAVYAIDVSFTKASTEKKVLSKARNNNISQTKQIKYIFPATGSIPITDRPVIVGTGPAGLFCGLFLARSGFRPILIERGDPVEKRIEKVEEFWKTGKLLGDSNVQFGEGGAGTFSDGKLNTLIRDDSGRNKKVLEEFVLAGADAEILYLNKPHIGTDALRTIVKNLRKEIEEKGGEIRFNTRLTDIRTENGKICAVEVNNGEVIETSQLVLAIGHSARDTFEMLHQHDIPMQAKPFAVGIRVEHTQKMINLSQFGIGKADYLPAADYKLTAESSNGRGVYSFCMCPGGYVVNASSEEGHLAINGMSYSGRDGKNANSAIVVTVSPADYPDSGALGGISFQRELEKKAYMLGKGKVPIQLFGDYKEDKVSTKFGAITPSMKGEYSFANLRELFPECINQSILEGMESFDRKIHGFAGNDTVLSGVESRTSSPVRIMRDELFESAVGGLFPCGEGAGYAGGITSAAMDGMKVAEAIAKKYEPVI